MAKSRRISNSLLTQDLMSLIKLLDKYHFTDDIMSKYPLENLLNIRQTGKLTDNVQIDLCVVIKGLRNVNILI